MVAAAATVWPAGPLNGECACFPVCSMRRRLPFNCLIPHLDHLRAPVVGQQSADMLCSAVGEILLLSGVACAVLTSRKDFISFRGSYHNIIQQLETLCVCSAGIRLCAYVELNTTSTETYSELKSWCMDQLPTAAVPSIIVVLPALPRSSAGKIQRGDLPRPAGLAQCIDGPPSSAAAQVSTLVMLRAVELRCKLLSCGQTILFILSCTS